MNTIKFTKMQATGNDFVVIDNRRSLFMVRGSYLAKKLCDRKFGIGADGLLLLEKSKKCDFKMRIFNPDGSEPKMCGNGIRCAAFLAYKNKTAPQNMSIETGAGILYAKAKNSKIKINITEPKAIKLGLDVCIDGKNYKIHRVNTGVPHAILYVNNIDNVDVRGIGPKIRYHLIFKPKGANVNFVKVCGKNKLKIRTYERGVEAETLACGTGSVASAIISSIIKMMKPPIRVDAKGGPLTIYFRKQKNQISNVFMEGPAEVVFDGNIRI